MAIVNASGFSYGTSTFGSYAFGIDVLPITVSSVTTFNSVYNRIRQSSATVSATSVITAIGGFTANRSASISSSSSTSSNGVRYRESSATVSVSSTASASANAMFVSGGNVTAQASISVSGESVIIEETDKFSYGTGAYGQNEYDQADLQTIVSAQSSTVVANGIRIQQGSATVSATSGESADSEKIYQGSATSSASVSILANGAFTVNVQPNTITSSATITPSILRIRNASGITTVESGELTHAREKWEVISSATNAWTDKASSSTTWTELVA